MSLHNPSPIPSKFCFQRPFAACDDVHEYVPTKMEKKRENIYITHPQLGKEGLEGKGGIQGYQKIIIKEKKLKQGKKKRQISTDKLKKKVMNHLFISTELIPPSLHSV